MQYALDGTNTKNLNNRDIVYFLRDGNNEELRYSLRSVVKNFPHRNIWFYGGKPDWLVTDNYVYVNQWKNKWGNVRMMLECACNNEKISPDFYIFNDDFFIMNPVEDFQNMYNGDLFRYIYILEKQFGINGSDYIIRLRKMINALLDYNPHIELKNYAIHTPILVNKNDLLDTFQKFPNIIMYRCLYGNFKNIGGVEHADFKVMRHDIDKINTTYLSTSDNSFNKMNVGKLIRNEFQEPSKYERN